MARIRTVKPDFFEDETLSRVSTLTRLLYIGLFCWIDRGGITEASARLIKSRVFPFDDAITSSEVEKCLTELVQHKRLVRFQFEGKDYFFCPKFKNHQHFHRDEKPKFKIPDEVLEQATTQTPCEHDASTVQAQFVYHANTPDIGYRISVNGINKSNDLFSPEQKANASDSGAIEELKGDQDSENLLKDIGHTAQKRWLKLYEDSEWIKRELITMAGWLETNPKRAPKNKKGRTKFIASWLARGWEKHRKTYPSLNTPPIVGSRTSQRTQNAIRNGEFDELEEYKRKYGISG